MTKEKTPQRRTILKLIRAGKVEVRCLYSYTDDYAYDAANDHGRTDWKPVAIVEDQPYTMFQNYSGEREVKHFERRSGHIHFYEKDFEAHGVRISMYNGVLNLRVHSNKVYELRIK